MSKMTISDVLLKFIIFQIEEHDFLYYQKRMPNIGQMENLKILSEIIDYLQNLQSFDEQFLFIYTKYKKNSRFIGTFSFHFKIVAITALQKNHKYK